jgi:hypothetical protein
MYLTRGGSVQRPLTCEPRGWLAGPILQPLMGWLHDHTLQEVVTGNPKPKVGAGQTPRPTSHHLVSYRLNQVGNPSLDPYKTPPTDGNQDTTLYL